MQARGSTIRRRREESGYGLTAFAALAQISPGYLSRIEHEIANPSPDVLKRIALALRRVQRNRAAIAEIARPEQEEADEPGSDHDAVPDRR